MSNADPFGVLAGMVAPAPSASKFRQAVVVAVDNTWPTYTYTLRFPDGTDITKVRGISNTVVAPGSACWVATDGSDMFVIGNSFLQYPRTPYLRLVNFSNQSIPNATWTGLNFTNNPVWSHDFLAADRWNMYGRRVTSPTVPVYIHNGGFQGHIRGWSGTFFSNPAVTLAFDATKAQSGAPSATNGSLKVTWPTGTGDASPAYINVTGLIPGNTYTLSGYVWNQAAQPAVSMGVFFKSSNVLSTTTGAWERLTVSWVQRDNDFASVLFAPNGATTAGQAFWISNVQIDEGSSALTYDMPNYDRIRIPMSGVWNFTACIEFAAHATTGTIRGARITSNGFVMGASKSIGANAAETAVVNLSFDATCTAGDYIVCEVFQNSTAALNVVANTLTMPFLTARYLGGAL